ncbi:hypothetical protein AAFF_G00367160 [Aldrovandia affinis]|uniref:Uncharacterized protein n=1 Tax=Aldrovandia affinis TaxID=143900 RepID=A0AAD7SHY5_9TELE|nr:hypothetical protein AAFF_G00367160 [Aldrovandia affinis]
MNVIEHCWGEAMKEAQPRAIMFVASQQGKVCQEWKRAFGTCYHLQNCAPTPDLLGSACLTQRDLAQVPACSEMLYWAQVSNGSLANWMTGVSGGWLGA